MSQIIPENIKSDLLNRGFSRRHLGRIFSLMTAGGALSFYNEAAMAQLSMLGDMPDDAVKINANENPMGPCPEALEALYKVAKDGGRYQYMETFKLRAIAAEQEGLKADYIMPFPGSSLPLHQVVIAFTSPEKSLVTADPGY